MWYLMPGLFHGLASRKSGRQRWAGSLRHWLLCNNELPVTIPPRHLLVFYHPFLFPRSMNCFLVYIYELVWFDFVPVFALKTGKGVG